MTTLTLDVTGLPAPQGSKRAWVNKHTGRAQMREQTHDKIQLWRQDVKAAATDHIAASPDDWAPLEGPLSVDVTFRFPRPKSHHRTGKNAHLLRDRAPAYPCTRSVGDLDKCLRSTWDALVTAGLFGDDSQVVHTNTWQVYTAPGELPGARITVTPLAAVSVADRPPAAADAAPAPAAGQEVLFP